ncbi:MAG: EthD domain-containing protein, partial [Candidatus Binatus sp.]
MIKLVYVIRKRADISEKDFHEYWLKKHGPLVRSFAKSMRAKKYVQSHTVFEDAGHQIRNTRPKMKETYDGITEVWWDT